MVLTVIRQSNTGHVSVWGLCWQGRYILPKSKLKVLWQSRNNAFSQHSIDLICFNKKQIICHTRLHFLELNHTI